MSNTLTYTNRVAAVLRHLTALVKLSEAESELVSAGLGRVVSHEANHELIALDAVLEHPRFVLSGWICAVRTLHDGRRQILDLYLPGDLIGYCSRPGARAMASYVCLTHAVCADASELAGRAHAHPAQHPGLAAAFHALEEETERRLIDQLVRNGRMMAHERLADLIWSLYQRHEMAGICVGQGFVMPLTQETLGDTVGLSTVHVNRTLQQLKREQLLKTVGTRWELRAPRRLASYAGVTSD
jgi:CRP-like cAMP-binding protein